MVFITKIQRELLKVKRISEMKKQAEQDEWQIGYDRRKNVKLKEELQKLP